MNDRARDKSCGIRQRREEQYAGWLKSVARRRIVAIEFGAGLAIPTVRYECEGRADVLIRVNPSELYGSQKLLALRAISMSHNVVAM